MTPPIADRRRRFILRLLGLSMIALLAAIGCDERSAEKSDSTIKSSATDKPDKLPASIKPDGQLPQFSDVTDTSGIAFRRFDDQQGLHRIMEANGGGVAFIDFDSDGRDDVFLTDGCRLPTREDDRETPSRLYQSQGGCRFEEVAASGLTQYGYAYGCTVGDYNDDGFDDIYVSSFGANSLWENLGDGTFTEVSDAAGVGDSLWGASVAFGDIDRDPDLELYVTNYVVTSAEDPKLCGRTQCSPTVFPAAQDALFDSNGDGTFKNITFESGAHGVDGKGLGVAIFDFNRDGWPDVYVANDGTPNFLFRNTGKRNAEGVIQFEESALLLDVANDFGGKAESSMGIAVGDLNGSGFSDIFLTHFYAETNTLYLNEGGEFFADGTSGSGLGPTSRQTVGFGTVPIDFDNNGVLDLFVTNGHVDDFTFGGEPYFQQPQLFRNDGSAHFLDVSAWSGPFFQEKWIGRGVASGDLDGDGDLDLVVSHQRGKSVVLRNDTVTANRSVILTLVGGPMSNRNAFGALVECDGLGTNVVREVIGGGSFQSACSRQIHIGLHKDSGIPTVKVTWPSGTVQTLRDITHGKYILAEDRTLMRAAD